MFGKFRQSGALALIVVMLAHSALALAQLSCACCVVSTLQGGAALCCSAPQRMDEAVSPSGACCSKDTMPEPSAKVLDPVHTACTCSISATDAMPTEPFAFVPGACKVQKPVVASAHAGMVADAALQGGAFFLRLHCSPSATIDLSLANCVFRC